MSSGTTSFAFARTLLRSFSSFVLSQGSSFSMDLMIFLRRNHRGKSSVKRRWINMRRLADLQRSRGHLIQAINMSYQPYRSERRLGLARLKDEKKPKI